jgi:hypothetical protein
MQNSVWSVASVFEKKEPAIWEEIFSQVGQASAELFNV